MLRTLCRLSGVGPVKAELGFSVLCFRHRRPAALLVESHQFADHWMLRQLAGIEVHQIALEFLKMSRQ